MTAYVNMLATTEFTDMAEKSEVPIDAVGARLTGLSRVGARTAIALALRNDRKITATWLGRIKKEMIERECQGLLEFIESPFTLEHVAGLDAVKSWLREDTTLLRRGALHTLPMGYLIAGRIGTGKTFLVTCWAGELGIPCVVFKNFRDRWVGATESNLEKIFAVLRALGQVVVFVDEADQAAGRRDGGDGDSGLSGRVYSMLAKEMSDTRNRGRIIWVFATSRPDLLEVDLKRQGRLDVHIPLFPPETRPSAPRSCSRSRASSSSPSPSPTSPPSTTCTGWVGTNSRACWYVRCAFMSCRRSRSRRSRMCSRRYLPTSARARTRASSNTWIWWRSRNVPTPGSCPNGSATSRQKSWSRGSTNCADSSEQFADFRGPPTGGPRTMPEEAITHVSRIGRLVRGFSACSSAVSKRRTRKR